MPRKSRELRLSQTKSLIEAYADAGIGHADRSFRFMNDMSARLERGKGLSKGQRNYLDNLIDQGVPKPKNEEKVKEILEAAEVDGMQEVSSTLKDFAYKVGKGWSLSEKQENFLSKLLAKAEKLKVNGRWRPTDAVVADLVIADEICRHKNGWYWQHRPGTAKAHHKVSAWLEWNARKKAIEDIKSLGQEVDGFLGDEPTIDQWACDKLLGAVKVQIAEMKDPRHLTGSMCFVMGKDLALISGEPKIIDGKIFYPCLVNGQLDWVIGDDIRKRQRK